MPTLTKTEISAMREFKHIIKMGRSLGRRRIVSMQGLERAGLVERITVNGIISDWKLTPAGVEWRE